jgi:hypothetical protein
MFCFSSEGNAEKVDVEGWSTAVLWESEVVSARLLFKPSASLADKKWIGLEMENHTQQPLQVGQTWMNLSLTFKEIPSGKVLATSGISGTFASIKSLPPGRHRFFGDSFESAPPMGLPPVTGLRVEVEARINTEITGGKRYRTPEEKPAFTLDWRYPSAVEIKEMSREMKQYLRAPLGFEKNLSRMSVLFKVPEVRDSQTLEDYLAAMKAARDPSVRHLLVPNVFAKYGDAPEVFAYYREAFRKQPDNVYADAATSSVWTAEFLEPLVQGCEKGKWRYFSALSYHSAEWREKPAYVARISAVLLKRYPILKRDVRTIPDKELKRWVEAVREAGAVADPVLVELLKPALEDKRQARINLGAGGWNEGRVCDRALIAILQILDGDSWVAFEAAGIKSYTKEERVETHDRVIGILKDRLKSIPAKQ